MSVEAAEKKIDTAPRIEGRYSMNMDYDKLGMHVPAYFDLLGNTKFFSAGKLWLNRNPGYSCTNAGGKMITDHIRPFTKFTVESIHEKLWKKFIAV